MKNKIKEENNKFFHLILDGLDYCDFYQLGRVYTEKEEYEDRLENFILGYNDSIVKLEDWNYGASKIVLMPKGKNFVIKIPLEGYNYNEFWEPFSGAGESADYWNYCKREVLLYQAAVEAGLEDIFLETFVIGDINGYPIYAQEKVQKIGCGIYSSKREREHVSDTLNKIGVPTFINLKWLGDFLDIYGEERLVHLYRFIEDNDIDDLHSGNYGYVNGYPVIFDYAGFYE